MGAEEEANHTGLKRQRWVFEELELIELQTTNFLPPPPQLDPNG